MSLDLERRFTALRVIGTIFKVLAWITLVLGILAALGVAVLGLAGSGPLGDWGLGVDLGGGNILLAVVAGVVVLIFFLICFLLLYAVGDTIYLVLSMEESTRHTAYMLLQQARAASAYSPPPPEYDTYAEEG